MLIKSMMTVLSIGEIQPLTELDALTQTETELRILIQTGLLSATDLTLSKPIQPNQPTQMVTDMETIPLET